MTSYLIKMYAVTEVCSFVKNEIKGVETKLLHPFPLINLF